MYEYLYYVYSKRRQTPFFSREEYTKLNIQYTEIRCANFSTSIGNDGEKVANFFLHRYQFKRNDFLHIFFHADQ